ISRAAHDARRVGEVSRERSGNLPHAAHDASASGGCSPVTHLSNRTLFLSHLPAPRGAGHALTALPPLPAAARPPPRPLPPPGPTNEPRAEYAIYRDESFPPGGTSMTRSRIGLALALLLLAGASLHARAPRLDLQGEPLPAGALARLGSVR